MSDPNPNRPTGTPPERDRTTGGTTPPGRGGPPRDDRGNSAMALIVGALAVALIIGAFFWFAGDTQDTATLEDPAVVEEDVGTTEEPLGTDEEATLGTEEETTTTEQETTVTEVEPEVTQTQPAEEGQVIGEAQQDTGGGESEQVIDETQE